MADQTAVLVSGSSGVIGTRVVQFLRQAGFRVQPESTVQPDAAELSAPAAEPTKPADGQSTPTTDPTATTAVHLRIGPDQDRQRLKNLLASTQAQQVQHLVLVSSASVYGAWQDNPIPLDETAPVRPNPETPFAVRHAEAEQTVQDWVSGGAAFSRSAVILRPAPVVSSPIGGPIGEAMLATAPVRVGPDSPPSQFLHLDDLARAVVLAVAKQLTGTYNVAPNGWLPATELRDLLGARPKIRLRRSARRLDRYVARRMGHEAPAGLLQYTLHPWVVTSDRLVAAGWKPRYGNDQAFVHADVGMPWDDMNARQRQYVSLAASGLLVLAIAAVAALRIRRILKRRRLK